MQAMLEDVGLQRFLVTVLGKLDKAACEVVLLEADKD